MSKGKSELLKPQYEKTEDKGYGFNTWGSETEQPEKPKPRQIKIRVWQI